MNILFLTMSSSIKNIEVNGIYTDLMRKFISEGHNVYIIYPLERRLNQKTCLVSKDRIHLLGVETLNVTKTNVIEKGLGQLLIEKQFKAAFKKYFASIEFELILYSTPPITFTGVIQYIKTRNPKSISYLLLKDIFPQNAVDIGMLSKSGIKGVLYRFYRRKERTLYRISDYIGCMSPANIRYVLKHNPEVPASKIEIAPNSYNIPVDYNNETDFGAIRKKYGLPIDKKIFIYGGNMGKPQGIPFLLDCLKAVKDRDDCHFVIVGDGTEYAKLETWVKNVGPKSISLFRRIPKEEYDILANSCDVGLIFLDYRFTIPNYPSRLLPYLMTRKPIIAATDPNSDVGTIAEINGFGVWCPSNSVESFINAVDRVLMSDIKQMGEKGYLFYLDNYTVTHTYNTIMQHFN